MARAVGAVGGHRLVGVAHGDDRGPRRDLGAAQPVGVAGAVPALVAWSARCRATGRSAGAALRMRSPRIVCWRMNSHSVASRAAGLVEDRVGDADLADVVQLGGAGDLVDLLAGHAEAARDGDRELGDLAGVLAQVGLLGLHRAHEHVARLLAGARAPVLVRVHALVGELQRLLEASRPRGAAARRRRRR